MAQSFVDLQNQALSRDFDAATYRAEARQAILDALGEIARKVQLPANERVTTITLTPGQASYALPSANIRVLGIFRDHEPLHYIPQLQLDDQEVVVGIPTAYALYAGSVDLWPTPARSEELTIRFLGTTGVPAGDGDLMAAVTGLPEDYLHGLVEYARFRLFRLEDDFEAASYWQAQWQATLNALRSDIQRRDRSRVSQVPGMYPIPSGPRFVRP
jgi:hypothetical protein